MTASDPIDGLIDAEIRRLLRETDGSLASARMIAARILRDYPGYADEADLAERVMTAVARAGVPVEIGRSAAS
jgi:hypothetical protein